MNLKFIKLILRYQRKYIKRNRRGKKMMDHLLKFLLPIGEARKNFTQKKYLQKLIKFQNV